MLNWLNKFNWGKGAMLGVIYALIALVIRQIEAALTMGYYQDPTYFGTWSPLMMPAAGPPPGSFYLISLVFSLFTGLSLAVFYFFVREVLPGKRKLTALYFSKMVIGLMLILGFLPMYLMINLPVGLLVSWFISGSIIIILYSLVVVKVLDK